MTDETLSISTIILTYNETANLAICLESLTGWVEEIFVVDSGSTDNTLEIAARYGAKAVHHPWKTYAKQFNWALDELPMTGEWVMRMDADERVMPDLRDELLAKLPNLSTDVTGLYLKRRVYFMGRWIRHGGYYPTWLLRIFRRDIGRCEARHMDEHIVLSGGQTLRLENDIIDENHKGLTFWTNKHEGYAKREAKDLVGEEEGDVLIKPTLRGSQAERKRWVKTRLYARLPLFWRAWLYFLVRYIFQFGFLDGRKGLAFHFLQACWYRFYVDAKILEMREHKRYTDEKNG
jgi:glycosyltransferase involved in cell wall biosynthesis